MPGPQCLSCKKRRVRCDSAKPVCRRCGRDGIECPGYKKPTTWITHDKFSNILTRSRHRPEQSQESTSVVSCRTGCFQPPNLLHPQQWFAPDDRTYQVVNSVLYRTRIPGFRLTVTDLSQTDNTQIAPFIVPDANLPNWNILPLDEWAVEPDILKDVLIAICAQHRVISCGKDPDRDYEVCKQKATVIQALNRELGHAATQASDSILISIAFMLTADVGIPHGRTHHQALTPVPVSTLGQRFLVPTRAGFRRHCSAPRWMAGVHGIANREPVRCPIPPLVSSQAQPSNHHLTTTQHRSHRRHNQQQPTPRRIPPLHHLAPRPRLQLPRLGPHRPDGLPPLPAAPLPSHPPHQPPPSHAMGEQLLLLHSSSSSRTRRHPLPHHRLLPHHLAPRHRHRRPRPRLPRPRPRPRPGHQPRLARPRRRLPRRDAALLPPHPRLRAAVSAHPRRRPLLFAILPTALRSHAWQQRGPSVLLSAVRRRRSCCCPRLVRLRRRRRHLLRPPRRPPHPPRPPARRHRAGQRGRAGRLLAASGGGI